MDEPRLPRSARDQPSVRRALESLMHLKGKVQRAPQLVQFISLRLLAPLLRAVPRNKAPRIASSNSTSNSFPKTRREKAESASPTQHEKHLFKKFE